MAEKFWLDEADPKELLRRANDLDRDGMFGVANQFRERASALEHELKNIET